MNRRAEVRLHGKFVGILEEESDGFSLTYDGRHVDAGGRPVSASLPCRRGPYRSTSLFPFFQGLLAEGELREIQARLAKISQDDGFGLLLATCSADAPGAVTVHELTEPTT